MPFIQFPFIEVPKELHKLVGEPTPGTRAYRREGTFKECGEWLEKLGEYYKGDVGLSTSSVVLFVPVSRASVYKRIKEGKLTAFFFYVTHEETRLFGAKRRAKERPFIVVSVSECKAWAEEIKRRVGFVDDPNESLFKESALPEPFTPRCALIHCTSATRCGSESFGPAWPGTGPSNP